MMNKKYKTGLVIGKFYPPHLGHKFLIDYGTAKVEKLYVLVCDDKKQKISAQKRASWLQTIHPDTVVKVIPEIYDDDNSERWAEHTKNFLGFTPEIVFSSEDYGITYTKFLNCEHEMVDKDRVNITISATKIRGDIKKYSEYLHPIVKNFFKTKIVVLGAESTGTTTLAKDLAKYYKTFFVPEYGRFYSESQSDIYNYKWSKSDFLFIAEKQNEVEDYLLEKSDQLLICDTDSFATKIWEERYLGNISDEVSLLSDNRNVDLYILTGDEIPFVQDGLRDGEDIRHEMQNRFREVLNLEKNNFLEVSGGREERLQKTVLEIDKILEQRFF
jgi:HTH-type transcriptional repressor of NAD biosynthesis genes